MFVKLAWSFVTNKKSLKALVLFFLLCVKINAQSLSFDQGSIKEKEYYEEIDIEVVHHKIIIPVTINNKVCKFLLDTGAPNLITSRLAKEINPENIKKIPISDANNQVDTMNMVSIKSIKLNNLNFENNAVLVTDLEEHFILKCYKIDGFIGSNLFKNSILKVSLKNKKITVTDNIRKLNVKSKGTKLTLLGQQKSPFIEIILTGENGEKGYEHALIDTGMDGFYEMSNRAYSTFSKEKIVSERYKSFGTSNIGLFGAPPPKAQILLSAKSLRINQTDFENLITTTMDDDNSRLGLDLLEYGDIIIDFKNKKFYLESTPTVLLDTVFPVYSPTLINQKFVIGHVWDKAYEDQLHFGDEIIRVGDFILSEMDFCDILELKNFRNNKTPYELEIRTKDNQTTTIKIDIR
ncbi:clan AA aspartic protease [Flavobacterium sp. IMCC34852]|uniref:Clan AA aspartic protease n=1 Tax=Flavobacterium rivulicola TaxID=2732161 RepID=A0A7Y3R7Y5_9FLAO|nr:retropepsin-like aspartic protease [Flavobacterium sp. IMCC34852]NNT71532.1 clan AA aspartic protease [Flavobacterium sp. IMCC34852]